MLDLLVLRGTRSDSLFTFRTNGESSRVVQNKTKQKTRFFFVALFL